MSLYNESQRGTVLIYTSLTYTSLYGKKKLKYLLCFTKESHTDTHHEGEKTMTEFPFYCFCFLTRGFGGGMRVMMITDGDYR